MKDYEQKRRIKHLCFICIHVQSAWIGNPLRKYSPMQILLLLLLLLLLMSLQPFCWGLAAFQFPDPVHSQYDPLDEGSALRKAATHPQDITATEYTHWDIYASNGIGTQDHSIRGGEDSSCLIPYGRFDRQILLLVTFKHILISLTGFVCIQDSRILLYNTCLLAAS
jgi:hypothetical protein